MAIPEELNVELVQLGNETLVRPMGEVDVYTCPRLREALIDAASSGALRILVDMRGVRYIDSMGLGVLLSGLKQSRARGATLELICTNENILKILRITGLDDVFVVHETPPTEMSSTA